MDENIMYPGVEIEENKKSLTELATELNQASPEPETESIKASMDQINKSGMTIGPGTEEETETETETEEVKIERFDVETESKLMKAFLKIFPESDNIISEEKMLLLDVPGVCDQAHVCMCIARTDRAKIVLRRFYDNTIQPKIPNLEFKDPGNSMFSLDYVLNILKVLDVVSDHFRIIEGTDSPCIIESEDFKFLLAPRIESD